MAQAVETTVMKLEVCAPDRASAALDVVEVVLPGRAGEFTVLPGHTPRLASLEIGNAIATDPKGNEHAIAISGGFAKVLDNTIVLLSPAAERGPDIDLRRAQHAQTRAEERLAARDEDIDVARATLALHRALARIGAAEHTHAPS